MVNKIIAHYAAVMVILMAALRGAEAAGFDIDNYSRLSTSCLYETKELFGSQPKNSAYKSDATLLQPDSFT